MKTDWIVKKEAWGFENNGKSIGEIIKRSGELLNKVCDMVI